MMGRHIIYLLIKIWPTWLYLNTESLWCPQQILSGNLMVEVVEGETLIVSLMTKDLILLTVIYSWCTQQALYKCVLPAQCQLTVWIALAKNPPNTSYGNYLLLSVIKSKGYGVNKGRQEMPMPHTVYVTWWLTICHNQFSGGQNNMAMQWVVNMM